MDLCIDKLSELSKVASMFQNAEAQRSMNLLHSMNKSPEAACVASTSSQVTPTSPMEQPSSSSLLNTSKVPNHQQPMPGCFANDISHSNRLSLNMASHKVDSSIHSSFVMTPPSPYYSEMMPSIPGSDSSLIYPWQQYHHAHVNCNTRTQHAESNANEWHASLSANSFSGHSANSSLSAYHQIPVPSVYPNRVNSMIHHHTNSRPNQEAFYQNVRLSGPYNSHSYYSNSIFNFSPESNLSVSSDGSDSSANHHSHLSSTGHAPMSATLTESAISSSGTCSLVIGEEEDTKPNIAELQHANAATTSYSAGDHSGTGAINLNSSNWSKKPANSSTVSGKTRTRDKYRVVYTDVQRTELEREFHLAKRYITISRKAELASRLMLSERQVKIWFQNRRAKDRKHERKLSRVGKRDNKNEVAFRPEVNSNATYFASKRTDALVVDTSQDNVQVNVRQHSAGSNLLMPSLFGNTIGHGHSPVQPFHLTHSEHHSMPAMTPTQHCSTYSSMDSRQSPKMGAVMPNGYHDKFSMPNGQMALSPSRTVNIRH